MRLAKAHIEGYRSIRDTMEFVVDPRVTVVLGANDHGKTNLIEAFLHLNDSQSFEADHLNWDRGDDSVTLPYVRFEFLLDEPDKTDLARLNAAHTALE
ncbi:MAG TPA: AAA family ATPase, partial [Gaiellaceae bacterium]|nr:AAA family ATPase [Gaiellaceae bacterium]